MIYVSRKEHFNAAHKLYNPQWSKEKNQQVFGPCANENWHGHNYDLIITVSGETDPETGFVVDLKKLSVLIKAKVLEPLDHQNLNVDVSFLQGKMPTTEVLAMEIWNILDLEVPAITKFGKLYSVKLYETPRNFVEYFGPQL